MALAALRPGELAARLVKIPGSAGANAAVKVPAIVAGMVAGADSLHDLDVLCHGAVGRLFAGVRAPERSGRSCGRSPGDTSASSGRSRRR
jgi:hypothetical protein